jgi:hypothetical protein
MPPVEELKSASEPIPAESVMEEEPPEMETPIPDITEPPMMESLETEAEAELSEADFDPVIPDAGEAAPDSWSAPSLPDVAALPEIVSADIDSEEEADPEPSSEMASQLDVPPLNLATPAQPEQSESASAADMEDQEIEDLLATMMTPVTAAAGN